MSPLFNRFNRIDTPLAFLATCGFLVLLVGGLVWGFAILELPVEQLSADPAVSFNAHPLTGSISYLGVLFWCATAAICLFSWAMLSGNRSDDVHFLFFSGFITLILLIDDLFMFHEAIFPWYLRVPQRFVYLGYGIMLLLFLFRFRSQILLSEYRYLVVAVVLLVGSVAGDFVLPQEGGIPYLAEDLFKLFGIVAWFFYFLQVCVERVRYRLTGGPMTERQPDFYE